MGKPGSPETEAEFADIKTIGSAKKGGIAIFRLLILVALAGAGLLALPAFAAVVTTFSLDTNDLSNDDTFSGPVFTSTLELGQP